MFKSIHSNLDTIEISLQPSQDARGSRWATQWVETKHCGAVSCILVITLYSCQTLYLLQGSYTACLLRKYITLSASHEYILMYSKWVSLFEWLWNGSSQCLCCLSLHVACCRSLVRFWMLMLDKLIKLLPCKRNWHKNRKDSRKTCSHFRGVWHTLYNVQCALAINLNLCCIQQYKFCVCRGKASLYRHGTCTPLRHTSFTLCKRCSLGDYLLLSPVRFRCSSLLVHFRDSDHPPPSVYLVIQWLPQACFNCGRIDVYKIKTFIKEMYSGTPHSKPPLSTIP